MGANIIKRFYFTLIVFIVTFLSVVTFAVAEGATFEGTASDFRVSPVFGDNMVFQQNEPIKIWGTSESEGEYVNVVFDGSVASSEVKDGKWQVELAPRSYSAEPKVLQIIGNDDSDYITFENITIGDVWWVMGQSNAEFSCSSDPLWDNFEASLTGTENITLFDLKEYSFTEKSPTRWRKMNKYSAYDASALACFTAKQISDMTQGEIPQGMVIMAYSGHELSAFLPPELAKKHSSMGKKSNIYTEVIDYTMNMPIKGIIWYQGEADAGLYHDYAKKLSDYISWLRNEKAQTNKNFPIYSIELSPCFNNPDNAEWQYIDFGAVRGEMGILPSKTENFNICVTSDYWSDKTYVNNLHPTNKSAIAMRLAFMIIAKEYGFGGTEYYFGPTLKSAELSDDKCEAVFSFENCAQGLVADKTDGFLVIDKDWNAIDDVSIEIIAPDKLKITAPKEICVVKYHTETQSTFGEHVFLKNSAGVPASAFTYTFAKPKSPTTPAGESSILSVNKYTVTGLVVLFVALAAAVVIFLKKKRLS